MEKFNTHGGYFSPQGYSKVTEGGTHEENPNGGVQLGVDPEGVPNMLEENEPVYDDFVYSDNIRADKKFLNESNIPEKYAGKLYSEIADALMDEASERPLDGISNNGLEKMLGRLADSQEKQKAYREQKDLEKEIGNLSPEEAMQLEQLLAAGGEQNPTLFGCGGRRLDGGGDVFTVRDNTRVASLYGQNPGFIPMSVGQEFEYSGRLDDGINGWAPVTGNLASLAQAGIDLSEGNLGQAGLSALAAVPFLGKMGKVLRAVKGTKATGKAIATGAKVVKDVVFPKSVVRTAIEPGTQLLKSWVPTTVGGKIGKAAGVGGIDAMYYGGAPLIGAVRGAWKNPIEGQEGYEDEPTLDFSDLYNYSCGGKINKYPEGGQIDEVTVTADKPIMPTIKPDIDINDGGRLPQDTRTSLNIPLPDSDELWAAKERQLIENGMAGDITSISDYADGLTDSLDASSPYPTWMRYAAPVTNALLGLYNVFQKPDKYEIPAYNPIVPSARMHLVNPTYTPVDRNEVVNTLLANHNGTVRALKNSGIGPGTTAAIIAADNNAYGNIGNAMTNAALVNSKLRNEALSQMNANAQTLGNFNMAQEKERAAILNNAMLRNAQNALLLQQLNNAAEGEKYAAIANSIGNVGADLSGMGNENFRLNAGDTMFQNHKRNSDGTVSYNRKNGGTLLKKYKK